MVGKCAVTFHAFCIAGHGQIEPGGIRSNSRNHPAGKSRTGLLCVKKGELEAGRPRVQDQDRRPLHFMSACHPSDVPAQGTCFHSRRHRNRGARAPHDRPNCFARHGHVRCDRRHDLRGHDRRGAWPPSHRRAAGSASYLQSIASLILSLDLRVRRPVRRAP